MDREKPGGRGKKGKFFLMVREEYLFLSHLPTPKKKPLPSGREILSFLALNDEKKKKETLPLLPLYQRR